MEIRILGTVELQVGDQRVELGGPKQRAVLALLALDPGEIVTRDRLIEALWGEHPPDGVEHRLDVQVSRLRTALRDAGVDTATVERVERGYFLRAEAVRVDAVAAERLVEDARRRLAENAPEEARAAADEALALWRGRPLAELADDPSSQAAARRLEDLRLTALEAGAEADLALGRHYEALGGLQRLAASEPLREPVHALLMLALCRCGRDADALRVYDELRRRLSAELGADPGEQTRRLHEAILRHDPAIAPERPARATVPRPRRSRGRVLAGAVLAAGLAIAAIVVFAAGDDEPGEPLGARFEAPVAEDHLAFIDLREGRVLGSVSLADELGDEQGVTWAQGHDADWAVFSNGTLLKIDPRERRVVRSVGLGIAPQSMAVGLGSVWVAAGDRPVLLRLGETYADLQERYRLPTTGGVKGDGLNAVAIAHGSVWVAQGERRVLRIDPRSGRVLAMIPTPGAAALAPAPGAIWVAGGEQGGAYRIDPAVNAVVTRVELDPYVCCVAAGGGYAWAMNHRVWKLSSEGRVLSSTPIDGDGANLSWTGGALWVAEGVSGQDTRIRADDDTTRTFRTGGLALTIGVRGDVATVVVGRGVPDLLEGISGPVARIELAADALQPDDPALRSPTASPFWREQALDATCAGLLTLRAAPAPRGWVVAPGLADLPSSPDRRTWTFTIRDGGRFSPPSNAPVTAASMRFTIERALSPRMGSGAAAPAVLGDLQGVGAFRAGRADHIAGLRARGKQLVVRLRSPAADLPLRMTSRALCAVPEGTPPSPVRFKQLPIPSAGPYYIAEHRGGNAALLRANPNYRGPRNPHFTALLYEQGVVEPRGVDLVARGRADLVAGFGDSLRPGSEAARRFAATTAGRPHWARRPLLATHLLRLRTRNGPLADARVRSAVSLALDRRAMAGVFDDKPTARVLPPGVPGAVDLGVPQPDPARARELVGDRQVAVTYAGCGGRPACLALEAFVRGALRRVGVTVHGAVPGSPADVTFREVKMTAPDPLGFLAAAGGRRPPSPRPPPARAAVLAERIDEELSGGGAIVAFGTPTIGELASARLGCRRQAPFSFGDDLARLCLADD
jgi:DNA-binding SARP family transcriptional activator